MAKVKVTRKYQVTIPREVRERIDIDIGDELLVTEEGERIVMKKVGDLENLAGSWDHIESTDEFMREIRKIWETWRLK